MELAPAIRCRQGCPALLTKLLSFSLMKKRVVLEGLGLAVALSLLGLCLFADCTSVKHRSVLAPALDEIAAALGDQETQRMLFACAGTYLVAFVTLRRRLVGAGRIGAGWSVCFPPELWLGGLLVAVALAYAFDFGQASKSTDALTLLTAIMLGQAVALWECRTQNAENRNRDGRAVSALVILLGAAAVWQAEQGHFFQYRGQTRWAGPWDNPNTFGMLMGAGAVLAVGLLVWSLKPKAQSAPSAECGMQSAESSLKSKVQSLKPYALGTVMVVAAGAMGVGLVKSYSRGAWVGAGVGMLYLLGKAESRKQKAEMGRGKAEGPKAERLKAEVLKAARRWVVVAVICGSVAVLGFWGLRDTGWAMARRVYSVANANDFSWRNRVAAYEGALQMMAERPWFGFGWNQPERVYGALYSPVKVGEHMAIQLNDYFILGMTLGIPALACFVAYVGLGLRQKSPIANRQSRMSHVCRAGAVVLLVAFWFDEGLFKLATGATFWILLELGRAGDHEIHEAHENE